MSGQSNVGERRIYEAGDQRNYKDSEEPTRPDYEQGKENSHLPNDSSKLHLLPHTGQRTNIVYRG